jgi:integrase
MGRKKTFDSNEPKKSRGRKGDGSVYQLPNGKWMMQVPTDDGGRIRKTYDSYKEALARKTEFLHEKQTKGLKTPSSRTLGEFLSYWIENVVKPGAKPRTVQSYENTIKCHIEAAPTTRVKRTHNKGISEVGLARLTNERVHLFFADLAKDGITTRTRQLVLIILRRALEHAKGLGYISRNPTAGVELPTYSGKKPKPLTEDQANRLLAAAEGHRLYPLLYSLLATGARIGEMLALNWENVDLEGGTIQIEHTLVDRNGHLSLGHPKNPESRRVIPLTAEAIEVLTEHRRTLSQSEHSSGAVFPSQTGTWMSGTNFSHRIFKSWLQAAGLPKSVVVHDLRATAITLMQKRGVAQAAIARIVGHKHTSTTDRYYTHVDEEWKREGVTALASVLRRPPTLPSPENQAS